MFHVLDHAEVVFSGDLSQATRYVIEHLGKTLDEAIRSGIRILYAIEPSLATETHQAASPVYWERIEDWQID